MQMAIRRIGGREEEKGRLELCRNCQFYECELVAEYTQFKNLHPQNKNQWDENFSKEDMENFPGRDTVLYGYSETEDRCTAGNPLTVSQIECGEQNVAEGIGDHFKIEIDDHARIKENTEDRWEPSQPVFISAQTGQGKNFFIENTLIPYVKKINYEKKTNCKILILSNRLALKQQIKNHLDKKDELDDENNKIYHYNEIVDVMTYQGLLCKTLHLSKKGKNKNCYLYVICDEAHFFTSDAMFNPYTEKILSTIVTCFEKSIRVYMSATPYECLEYIIEQEEKCRELTTENKSVWMVFYHFKRDYSYLDVKAYSQIDELYEKIVSSVSEKKEKWLLFIDNKKRCATVKTELIEFAKKMEKEKFLGKENIFAVNAESKKDPIYQKIVNEEKLNKDTYVLISTSVLDNGVNLTGISHIVVSDIEKVKCLQMIGRARIGKGSERKTLYIKRFGIKEVNEKIKNLNKQQDAYHQYDLVYGDSQGIRDRKCVLPFNESENFPSSEDIKEYKFLDKYYNGKEADWKDAKHWFGRFRYRPDGLYLNKIARSLLDDLIPKYEFILNEMEQEKLQENNEPQDQKGKSPVGQKYLKYQLSWFGKEYYVDDDITFADEKKAEMEFMDFLKSYAKSGKEIDNKHRDSFKTEFTRLVDAVFGRQDRNKERKYGIKKINSILKEKKINYTMIEKSSVWIVKEHDWEAKEPD